MIFFNILIPYENLKLAKNKSFNFYLFQFDIKSHTKWTKLGCLFTHIKWPRVLRNYFRVHQLTTSTKELFYSHYKRSWTLRLVPLVYLYFHRNKIWSDFPVESCNESQTQKAVNFDFFLFELKKKKITKTSKVFEIHEKAAIKAKSKSDCEVKIIKIWKCFEIFKNIFSKSENPNKNGRKSWWVLWMEIEKLVLNKKKKPHRFLNLMRI